MGTRSLGNMIVRLSVALDKYKADWEEASAQTRTGAKEIEKEAKRAEKALDDLGATAKDTGKAVALAVTAAATGIVLMVQKSIDQADAMGKLAEKTGIATETLSAYSYGASLSNVSTETLSTSMRMLSRNVADNAPVLMRMGVATRDNAGQMRALDAVMGDVADKFASYKDGAGKAALAQELFGRSGVDMINMLNEGSVGLENMRLEAAKLGVVISTETSAAAAQFNDNLTRLHAASTGYVQHVVAGLLPVLIAAQQAMSSNADGAHAMDGGFSAMTETLRALIVVGGNVAFTLKGIGTEIGVIAAQGSALGLSFTDMLNPAAAAAKLVTAGTEGWRQFIAIGREARAEAEKSRSAFDVWEKGVMQAGVTVKKVKDEMGKVDAPTKPEKAARASGKSEEERELERRQKLLAELSGVQASYMADLERLNALRLTGNIGEARYIELVTALISKQPMARALMNDAAKAHAEEEKATKAAAKAYEDRLKVMADGVSKQEEELQKLQEHNAALGLSKEAVAELNAAKLEEQASAIEGLAIRKSEMGAEQALIDLMLREAVLRRQKAAEIRSGAAKETEIQGLKEAARENERFWDSVDRTAHDVFMSIEDGGSAAFKKITQTAKSTLLEMLYQLGKQQFLINIGMSASGGGGGGLAGLANNAGMFGGGGGGNMISSIANAAGFGNLSAGASGFGGSFASSVGGGLATDAMGATVAEGAAGATLGAGSSIGAALAAIPGWGWALAGTLALGSMFGGKKGGPKAEGGYAPGGLNIGGLDIGGNMQGSERGDVASAKAISDSMSLAYANAAKLLGLKQQTANIGVFYSRDPEGDSQSQVQVVTDGYDRSQRRGGIENVGRNPEDVQAEFAAEGSRLIIAKALQDSGLDQEIKDYFAHIDINTDGATLAKAIDNAMSAKQLKDVLGQFGPVFSDLANISVDAKAKMAEAAGGLQTLLGNLSTYNANFMTAEEQRLQVAKNITETVNAAGGDLNVGQLLATTRDGYRAMVEAAAKDTSDAGIKLWTALINVAGAFAQITPAAEKAAAEVVDLAAAAKKEMDAAMSALQRAVDGRRKAAVAAADDAQQLVGTLQAIFDTLKGNVRDLYGEVDATREMQAAHGEAFIAIALARARAGGGMPDDGALSDAISAARSGMDGRQYGKQADRDFDRLVLAGRLKELQNIAGPQLTAAEQSAQLAQDQVDYLDKLLDQARSNLDAVNGVDTSVMSVESAVDRLYTAFLKVNPGAKLTPIGGAIPAAAAGAGTGGGPNFAGIQNVGAGAANVGWDGKDPGYAYAGGLAPSQYFADLQGSWNDPRGNNWTPPAFARGGDHAGGWMKAGEHGEELIYSPPARIFNATDTDRILGGGGGNAEMAAELRQLRAAFADVARELGAIKDATKTSTRYLKGMTRGGSSSILTEAA